MWDYTWFGTIAMLLQLVPIFSFFFLLTSATGAALWTAKLEQKARRPPVPDAPSAIAPVDTQEYDPDEPPPPYVDNPV